jgi:hypothetical protein
MPLIKVLSLLPLMMRQCEVQCSSQSLARRQENLSQVIIEHIMVNHNRLYQI